MAQKDFLREFDYLDSFRNDGNNAEAHYFKMTGNWYLRSLNVVS